MPEDLPVMAPDPPPVELLHTATLIHDDIEDGDELIDVQVTDGNNDIVLATKAAGPTRQAGRPSHIRGGRLNFNLTNLREALHDSLRRLQTDHVDLYQLHWPSRNVPVFGQLFFDPQRERPCVPIEETLAALKELIDEGKVRHIGVSNVSERELARARAVAGTATLTFAVSVGTAPWGPFTTSTATVTSYSTARSANAVNSPVAEVASISSACVIN